MVGITFAWASNAQALLQTGEIREIAEEYPGGINVLACIYQLAILVLLATLAVWGIAGTGVLHDGLAPLSPQWARIAGKASMYALLSLSIRECWSVVDSFRHLLVSRDSVTSAKENGQPNPSHRP
jgi:predicted DNA repair protein MutK